jgi:hypothetical protein
MSVDVVDSLKPGSFNWGFSLSGTLSFALKPNLSLLFETYLHTIHDGEEGSCSGSIITPGMVS